MAEPDALDSRLRDALGQAAQPGDSTGVADVIRARVAAGDPGTSVASATAPGWGGGAWSWMPWLGMIVVAGLVGGGVGVSGAVGRPDGGTVVDVPAALVDSAPAYACVGGERIGRLGAGTRVLAVQRSEDLLWVGVRDPGSVGSTVWLALGDVALDGGKAALDALPVGGECPVVVVSTPTPEPEPDPVPAPGDSTAPVISQASATSPFYAGNGQTTTVSAVASDNRGVTRIAVRIVRPDGVVESGEMQSAGGTWLFTYSAQGHNLLGLYRFELTAFDAAGNTAAAEVTVQGS